MKFIYGTRQLPQLQFASASQREAIPEDAQVFAVCDGAMTIRQQDAEALSLLTEQEQSDLQELISQSERVEVAGRRCLKICRTNPLRSILRSLINL